MSDLKSDDTETAREAPEDGPFAVKWMAGTDKAAIKAAAKRARKTVGEWLGEAARAYIESERESFESPGFDMFRPDEPRSMALLDPPAPLSIDDLDRAYDLGLKIAEKEGRKLPSRGVLLSAVKRRLRERLGA